MSSASNRLLRFSEYSVRRPKTSSRARSGTHTTDRIPSIRTLSPSRNRSSSIASTLRTPRRFFTTSSAIVLLMVIEAGAPERVFMARGFKAPSGPSRSMTKPRSACGKTSKTFARTSASISSSSSVALTAAPTSYTSWSRRARSATLSFPEVRSEESTPPASRAPTTACPTSEMITEPDRDARSSSNEQRTPPKDSVSPSFNRVSRSRRSPFSAVPFWLPRSLTNQTPPRRESVAWRRDTSASGRETPLAAPRPTSTSRSSGNCLPLEAPVLTMSSGMEGSARLSRGRK